MESICGKQSVTLDSARLCERVAAYPNVLIDLGTGDGRYVCHIARRHHACLALGIDSCRENLRHASRTAPPNALFLIADALALPGELAGLAAIITINFPWGSLLTGLLQDAPALRDNLAAIARPGARLDIRLNAGALAEAGWSLDASSSRIVAGLRQAGFMVRRPVAVDAAALRACPTTWAKRLAFGRDPRALHIRAVKQAGLRE